MLDTTTNAFVAATPVGGSAYHVGVSPNGATVYVPGQLTPSGPVLVRLSPTTHAVVGSTAIPDGRAVAFSADSSRGYVATNQSVVVVDTATHAVAATIPFALAVDGRPNAIVTTPPPPPSPPSNLRATVSGNRVSLAWDPSPSVGLTGYVLEGGVTPGSVLATIPTGSTAPTFTFDAPTGAFFVRMRAVSGGQRSAPSNEISDPGQRAAAPLGTHESLGPRRWRQPRPQLEDPVGRWGADVVRPRRQRRRDPVGAAAGQHPRRVKDNANAGSKKRRSRPGRRMARGSRPARPWCRSRN